MLQQFRRIANSLFAKILLTLLILSFGLWGIGDIFRNIGGHTLASIGRTDVSIEAFRKQYDAQRQALARKAGKPISNEEAETFGLRKQVLSEMITGATLDEQARHLGLNVSKGLIIRDIMQNPVFFGPTGSFDRTKFERLLYGINYNEPMYIRERVELEKRRIIAQSLTAGIDMPALYGDAVNRMRNETRVADYIVLTHDRFAKIAPPTEEALAKYYDVIKPAYNTIERRSLKLLTLKADDFAKKVNVSDEDARAIYDRDIDKYGKPEKREIEQIILPDDTSVQAIGTPPNAATIDALVKENKITRNSLGLLTKKDVIDPAVADAAFSLRANTYSSLIMGQFGPVVVRITKIEPGEITSFDKVKPAIKQEIALTRARDAMFDVHDKIENERVSGARLDEISAKLNYAVTTTSEMDKTGVDADGKKAGVEPAVLEDAFQSEQGVDNEPILLPNKDWVWFEVNKITPERERPLTEVRKQVEVQWLQNQQRVALSEKAHALLDDIKKGKSLADVAREQQLAVKTTAPFTREGKVADFSASAVNSAFRVAVNASDTGLSANNKDRLVFVVKKSEVAKTTPLDPKLTEAVASSMRDELLYQFLASAQQDFGMTVNTKLAEQLARSTEQ